jgi:hypothetical protein
MAQQLDLIADASGLPAVPAHRIAYRFPTGERPEPPVRLGNRRAFGPPGVRRVARALGRPTGGEGGR